MKVFLSYSDADQDLAKRVAGVLKSSGFQVWDGSEVLPGDNPGETLAEALEESEAMVVLLTPYSVASHDVRAEIGYALGQRRYKDRLIPVVAAPPEELPPERIPWILRRMRMIDLSQSSREEEGIHQIAEVLQERACA